MNFVKLEPDPDPAGANVNINSEGYSYEVVSALLEIIHKSESDLEIAIRAFNYGERRATK